MDDKPRPYQMLATESFWKKIDDWRRQQEDLPSRAEAIRRLVDLGLEARKPAGKRK
jgi:hypothetical protein